jgi:hypothetical protein
MGHVTLPQFLTRPRALPRVFTQNMHITLPRWERHWREKPSSVSVFSPRSGWGIPPWYTPGFSAWRRVPSGVAAESLPRRTGRSRDEVSLAEDGTSHTVRFEEYAFRRSPPQVFSIPPLKHVITWALANPVLYAVMCAIGYELPFGDPFLKEHFFRIGHEGLFPVAAFFASALGAWTWLGRDAESSSGSKSRAIDHGSDICIRAEISTWIPKDGRP